MNGARARNEWRCSYTWACINVRSAKSTTCKPGETRCLETARRERDRGFRKRWRSLLKFATSRVCERLEPGFAMFTLGCKSRGLRLAEERNLSSRNIVLRLDGWRIKNSEYFMHSMHRQRETYLSRWRQVFSFAVYRWLPPLFLPRSPRRASTTARSLGYCTVIGPKRVSCETVPFSSLQGITQSY